MLAGVKQIPKATNGSHIWPAQIAAQTQTKICVRHVNEMYMDGRESQWGEKKQIWGKLYVTCPAQSKWN